MRFPTEPTPPSQYSFILFLAGAVCISIGICLLVVGRWLSSEGEISASTTLMLGGGAVGFGLLVIAGWYIARRLLP
jgi:hypothetical protein